MARVDCGRRQYLNRRPHRILGDIDFNVVANFLIIDGYNLLHAAGLARASYGPGDLARQRHLLVVKVAQLLTLDERKRCTIVFDAIDAPANLPDRFHFEELRILFAERGHEADELIEILIRQHSAPRQLVVISSDHRLQKAIRRRRGFAMDSEAFLKQRESPGKPVGPVRSLKPAAPQSEKELEFWLKEFDGVHPSNLIVDSASESSPPKSRWDREIEDLQNRLKDRQRLDDWLNESDSNL